jgi:protein gp37
MDKRMGRVQWGDNGTRSVTSPANWNQVRRWNAEAVRTGVRRKVFCGSLCDWLEDRHDTNAWRISLLELIELTRGLDWLMLTKRPENAVRLIQQAAGRSIESFFERNPHVWIGTSVENQEQADKRIPLLLTIPANVRFLSMEPLLGPIDVLSVSTNQDARLIVNYKTAINWVIVGGESGHNARPMHPEWARSIRDQCQAAGVPFFFKQWGEWHHDPSFSPTAPKRCYMDTSGTRHEHRGSPDQFRNGHLAFDRVGKHLAGHLLDCREWSEVPVITHS